MNLRIILVGIIFSIGNINGQMDSVQTTDNTEIINLKSNFENWNSPSEIELSPGRVFTRIWYLSDGCIWKSDIFISG